MRRIHGIMRFLLSAVFVVLICSVCVGATLYEVAASLADKGKEKEASALVAELKKHPRKVQINATIIICSEEFRKKMDEETQVYIFGRKKDERRMELPVSCAGKSGVVAGIVRDEERVSLLMDLIQQSSNAGVASIFGIQVFDSQLVRVSVVPDVEFPEFDASGKPVYAYVRKYNRVEKVQKTRRMPISFDLRPLIGEDGEVAVEFGAKQGKIDPFPAANLNQSLPWVLPGCPAAQLHEPRVLKSGRRVGSKRIELPRRGYLLLTGVGAKCTRLVTGGVPLLKDLPEIGKLFGKKSTVEMPPAEVYIILEFRSLTR